MLLLCTLYLCIFWLISSIYIYIYLAGAPNTKLNSLLQNYSISLIYTKHSLHVSQTITQSLKQIINHRMLCIKRPPREILNLLSENGILECCRIFNNMTPNIDSLSILTNRPCIGLNTKGCGTVSIRSLIGEDQQFRSRRTFWIIQSNGWARKH